jgi:ferric-dicitrate binding protein FerR (iron transport regulator)
MREKQDTYKDLTREEVADLILAALKGRLSDGQRAELERWLAASEGRRAFFERVCEEGHVRANLELYKRFDARRDWRRVDPVRRLTRRWLTRAASVLLLAGAAWVWLAREAEPVTVAAVEEVKPGTYKARLTLEAGQTVTLGERVEEVATLPEGVTREGVTRLAYRESEEAVAWHVLEVPRGGEYQLELSDGTLIALNAGSRIRYPNRFEGPERCVELQGEAFFQVKREEGDRPFVVDGGNGLRVRVLGTSFNLKAYADERQQATLVTGSVAVECGGEEVVIRPGERLTWNGEEWSVRTVDVSPYLTWRGQRFVFEDELLEEVLKQLERWYDIAVYIRYPSLKEIRYTGNLPKYEEVDKVLNLLELAARVHFRLDGRVLFVEKE